MFIVKDDHLQKAKQHHKARKDNQEKVAILKIPKERTSLEGGQTFYKRMMITTHKEKATKEGKVLRIKYVETIKNNPMMLLKCDGM
jgi:hypothetical protein